MEILTRLGVDPEAIRLAIARHEFQGKNKARVYSKLASLLNAGVPLPKGLEILLIHATHDGRKPNTSQAVVLRAWLREVQNGRSLGRAIQGWVPDSDRILIEAGERSGALSKALENALFIERSMKRIRSTITNGISYPLLLVFVAILLLLMFSLYILPGYEEIRPREEWYGGAATMLALGDAINFWIIPTLIVSVALIATILYTMSSWVGPTRAKFDNFPPWSIYRLINGSGFMLSVSTLVRAGVQVPEILKILRRDATPWFVEKVDGARRHVDNGLNLGEALYRAGHGFPEPEAVIDLRLIAELEGFDEKLEKMGIEWVENSVERVSTQMGFFKNASMILLGMVFGAIVIGITSINLQLMESGQNRG